MDPKDSIIKGLPCNLTLYILFLFKLIDTKQPSISAALAKSKAKANPVTIDSSDDDIGVSSAAQKNGVCFIFRPFCMVLVMWYWGLHVIF